jgi:selenocysteine-specific elongation factor
LQLVKLDAAELVQNSFLENAPVVAVSAKTGDGIENLKQILREITLKIPARKNENVTRLPIDRAFSVKGFGTVVTGTLVAGEINEADESELLPVARKVRVRGIQTHGKTVSVARAGQRIAVNLGGIDVAEIKRGDVLAAPETLRPTQIVDVELEVLPDALNDLKSRQKIRVHLGTTETLARLQILEEAGEIKAGVKGLAQIRFETAIIAVPGEHFIVRSVSPARTIAGGEILDALAVKHRRKDFIQARKRLDRLRVARISDDKEQQLKVFLEIAGEHGMNKVDLAARTNWRDSVLQTTIENVLKKKALVQTENVFVERSAFENLLHKTVAEIEAHHKREPLARGLQRETLREKVFSRMPPEIFRATLHKLEQQNQIILEKDFVRAASYNQNLLPDDEVLLRKIEKIYMTAGLEVPSVENALAEAITGTKITKVHAHKILRLLIEKGELQGVTPEFYFCSSELNRLIQKMRDFAGQNKDNQTIDVAKFKDLAQVSRKYAIPLLEYFDREKITRRIGDKRIIL